MDLGSIVDTIPILDQVCRICLATNVKMYDIEENRLGQNFEQLTGIMIYKNDGLPESVCWECRARLTSGAILRQKATTTHRLLLQQLLDSTTNCIKISDIKSISRSDHNLKSCLTLHHKKADHFDLDLKEGEASVKAEFEEIEDGLVPLVGIQDVVDTWIEVEAEQLDKVKDEELSSAVVKDERSDLDDGDAFDGFYDSDDDLILSEVRARPKMQSVASILDTIKTDVKPKKSSKKKKLELNESLFTITNLTIEEQLKEMESKKQSQEYVGAKYKCSHCCMGFPTKERYEVHKYRHSMIHGEYECLVCKIRMKSDKTLKIHMEQKHTRRYSCKECDFVTTTKDTAKEHEDWHAEKIFKCEHCDKEFSYKSTYRAHVRIKHTYNFVCSFCGRTFVSKAGISAHKRKEHHFDESGDEMPPLEGPYCEVCDVKFVTNEAHARHLRLSAKHKELDTDGDKKMNDVKKKEVARRTKNPRRKKEVDDGEKRQKRKLTFMKKSTKDIEEQFQITFLTHEEQIAEVEARKQSSEYINARFKCVVCYKAFNEEHKLNLHLVRHSDAYGKYDCPICKVRKKSELVVKKHLQAQHSYKYSCTLCPFVTKNRYMARKHKEWHDGSVYQCAHCPSVFTKVSTYKSHTRLNHVSDFVCGLCGYTFVSKRGVEVHKSIKHVLAQGEQVALEGPFCEACDVKFISEEAYNRHLKLSGRHTKDDDPNRIRNDSANLGREIRTKPSDDPAGGEVTVVWNEKKRNEQVSKVPSVCEECGKEFQDQRAVLQHVRRVHPEKHRFKPQAAKKRCMCEQCGRFFTNRSHLRYHMWAHSGGRHFKCHLCDKSFTVLPYLKLHMKAVHSAEKQSFECEQCGKHFTNRGNLRRHLLIHEGVRAFKCEFCDKGFINNDERKTHTKHVHLNEPWPKRAKERRLDGGDDLMCTTEGV